ncbi:hypothetical protein V8E36_005895 [Tilletia maclaganii]
MLRRGNKQRKDSEPPPPAAAAAAAQQQLTYPHGSSTDSFRHPSSPYNSNPAMAQASSASLQYLPPQAPQHTSPLPPSAAYYHQQPHGAYAYSQPGNATQGAQHGLSQQQQQQQQQQQHFQQPKAPSAAYKKTNQGLEPSHSYSYQTQSGMPSPTYQHPPPSSPTPGSAPANSSSNTSAMGRSQSALNFFFNKAKGTFTSSSSSSATASQSSTMTSPLTNNQGVTSSNSLSSIMSQPDNGQVHGGARHPTSGRLLTHQAAGMASISINDEPISSPTKRNIFGMNRDRKASNASQNNKSGNVATNNASAYPLPNRVGTPGPGPRSGTPGPGGTTNTSPGMPYGAFSKSQSDLLSTSSGTMGSGGIRPELPSSPTRNLSFDQRPNRSGTAPSPLAQYSQLPPVPGGAPGSGASGGGDEGPTPPGSARYLRSPTSSNGPGGAFSRSVDDLSQMSISNVVGGGAQQQQYPHGFGSAGNAKGHLYQQQQQYHPLPPPPLLSHDQGVGAPGGGQAQSPTLKGARQRGFGIGITSPVLKGERKYGGGGLGNSGEAALPSLPVAMLDNTGGGGGRLPLPALPSNNLPRQREFSAPQPGSYAHPSHTSGSSGSGSGSGPGLGSGAAGGAMAPPQAIPPFGHGRSESIPLSASSTAGGLGNLIGVGRQQQQNGVLVHSAGSGSSSGAVSQGSAAGAQQQQQQNVTPSQSVDSNMLMSPAVEVARHSRRPSKLSFANLAGGGGAAGAGDEAARRAAAAAAATSGGGALTHPQGIPPPPLPQGSKFQGFLLRNGNISLTLQQLSEGAGHLGDGAFGVPSHKGKEKEKDISRGWKPYRVILTQDGRLLFFKPPASLADEVRAAFPTTIVRPPTATPHPHGFAASGGAGSGGGVTAPMVLDAEALKKAGLSSQSLMQNMGSSNSSAGSMPPPPLPAGRGGASVAGGLAMTASGSGGAGPGLSSSVEEGGSIHAAVRAGPPAWHNPGKHAELVLSNDEKAPARWGARVIRGSVDALAHELVFATQLVLSDGAASVGRQPAQKGEAEDDEPVARPSAESRVSSGDEDRDTTGFVCAIILNLIRFGHPVYALAQALHRWASLALASSAQDTSKLPINVKQRLAADAQEQSAFHDEVRARIVLFLEVVQIDDALGANASVRDVLEKLAALASTAEKPVQLSLPTGSESKSVVLTDWVNKLAEQGPGSAQQRRPDLTALVQTRFSGQVLLSLDQLEVAQQICLFHRDRLRYLVTPRLTLSKLTATGEAHATEQAARALFSFDSLVPHYLTRLVLDQLLPTGSTGLADGINKRLAGGGQHNAPAATPPAQAAKQRAALIRHWIAIGIHLHILGDYAGWVAICAALCSRAVARLDSTWRFVADKDRELVGLTWAPKLASLGWAEGTRGRIDALLSDEEEGSENVLRTFSSPVPYFGDACVAIRRLPAAPPGSGQLIVAENMEAAERVFGLVFDSQQRDEATSALVSTGLATESPDFEPILEYQATLQALADARMDTDIARYLNHSLHAEPKTLGAVEPYWRQPRSARAASNALVPIMFPQPLPHLSLVDRASIKAGVTEQPRTSSLLLDSERTITARSHGQRAQLSGSPLARSLTFPPTQQMRSARSFPFNRIAEWSSTSSSGGAGDEHVLRIGSDLVLRAVGESAASTPSSPRASKRFSQEMSRQTRPQSQVSKRSSLPASNRSSVVQDTPAVLEVTLKAASLEKIADIMAMGVDHITTSLPDDNGEAPLSPARRARLSMDLHSFRLAFLGTFRTLCAPSVFFRMLTQRFFAAEAAGAEHAMPVPTWKEPFFPSWQVPQGTARTDQPIDWELVTTIRAGVLATFKVWVERFAQDFAEHRELYDGMNAFFLALPQFQATSTAPTASREADGASNAAVTSAAASAAKTAEFMQGLESLFRVRIMTLNTAAAVQDHSTPSDAVDLLSLGPTSVEIDLDTVSPDDLVNYLECIAAAFFRKVNERDLLVTAELFEMQASNLLGWFPARHATGGSRSGSDGHEPWSLSLYKLMEVLSQSSESGESVSLLQRLPSAVRDVLAVHQLLKGWLAIHIIEIKIGLQRRQARLERMIDALWICRARMVRVRSGTQSAVEPHAPFRDPTVASFVEGALVGALTTPESRLYLRAWQGVAMSRNASGETLKDLIPPASSIAEYEAATEHPSIPDLSWVLQSLAEAVSRDFPETEAAAQLINFDKQRLVWNLVCSTIRSRLFVISSNVTELASLRLRSMQTTLCNAVWDPRLFKEDAAYEASSASPASLPQLKGRALRPLITLLSDEQEKGRRQRQAQEYLSMLSKSTTSAPRPLSPEEQLRAATPSIQPTSNSSDRVQSPVQTQSEKKTRRMTAIFRGAVRLTEKQERPEVPNRSLNELIRLTPLQKPSYTAGLGNAQTAVWHNSQRSFVFHLTSQEGSKYLLQAPSAAELSDWITNIETSSKEIVLNSKGKPVARAIFTPLWGPSLIELAEKEGRDVPLGLERMLAEIEARGLREQGIYRISGAKSAIMALKEAFTHQAPETIDIAHGEFSDVHTIAGTVKQWFRDLPDPPVPFSHYDRIIEAEMIKDPDMRMHVIRDLVWDFPKAHFDCFRRIIEHLARVVEEAQHNKMFQQQIGLVFATSLLNPPPAPDSLTRSFANVGKAAHIVALVIEGHEWLFEPEPEVEQEPEVEPVAIIDPEVDGEPEHDPNAADAGDIVDDPDEGADGEEDARASVDEQTGVAGEDEEADLDDDDAKSAASVRLELPPLDFTPAPSDSAHDPVSLVTGMSTNGASADGAEERRTPSPAAELPDDSSRSALGQSQSDSTKNLNVTLNPDFNKSSDALAADIEKMLDAGLAPRSEQTADSPAEQDPESRPDLEIVDAAPTATTRPAKSSDGQSRAPVSRRRAGSKEESVYLDATDALEALDFAALAAHSGSPGYNVVTVRRPSDVKREDVQNMATLPLVSAPVPTASAEETSDGANLPSPLAETSAETEAPEAPDSTTASAPQTTGVSSTAEAPKTTAAS